MRNAGTLIFIGVLALLLIGGYWLYRVNNKAVMSPNQVAYSTTTATTTPTPTTSPTTNMPTSTAPTGNTLGSTAPSSFGVLNENNAVIVNDQQPGNSVTVARVLLANNGYIAIHKDNNGQPGAIIGFSQLLQKGQTTGVNITLNRTVANGETLYAMVHQESDNNTAFNAAVDKPVLGKTGSPVMTSFSINSQTSQTTPTPIQY